MIYTSYFAKLKDVENPIAICGKSHEWYGGPQFRTLAPKWKFFSDYKAGLIDSDGYTKQYAELVTGQLDPHKVVQDLMAIYPGAQNITLLCYEIQTDFCHRHLVAKWLQENGYPVKEFKCQEPPINMM